MYIFINGLSISNMSITYQLYIQGMIVFPVYIYISGTFGSLTGGDTMLTWVQSMHPIIPGNWYIS